MTCNNENSTKLDAVKLLASEGFDGLQSVMELLVNEAMLLEREKHLGVSAYERSRERVDYANGFKPKQLKTRIGKLDLQVPQVRKGDFYPGLLERGLRSEQALRLAIAEMYVQGVTTRKVAAITQELCGFNVTSDEVSRLTKHLDEQLDAWRNRPLGCYPYLIVDARYEKVRYDKTVVNVAVLVAYGVDTEGRRRILGVSTSLSEAEVHWRDFLQQLISRGLHGVKLIVSDAHAGLQAARITTFPSVPWQRCQFHLQQNAQQYVSKQHQKKGVAVDIRAIFNSASIDDALLQLKRVVKKYQETMPKLSHWLADNIEQGLTVMSVTPTEHWRRLRTSNMAERVNKEIKRRTRISGLFPNTDSCLRLVSAVLIEIDEAWDDSYMYLDMSVNL